MLPSLNLNADHLKPSIYISVGLNRPSWHINLHNPFYSIYQQILQTAEIEQSLFNSYDDFSCISRDVFKLEETHSFQTRWLQTPCCPCHLTFNRHLEPHNYTVLENFTDLLIIMSPKFSGNHLPAVPDVQITV